MMQIVRFLMVGVGATLVHYLVALAAARFLVPQIPYLANLAGFLVAVGVSYFGHLRFTYRVAHDDSHHRRRLPRFVVTAVSGLVFSQLVLAFVTEAARLPLWLGLAIAAAAVPAVTFVLGRLWVFRAMGR